VYVAERVAEDGVAFGGEPSGAWIWPDATLCPDGPLAACKLAELAADRPLAERAAAVETYPIRRRSVEVGDKAAVMDRVRERVTREENEEAVSTLDGVRVEREEGWMLVRASGTQPLVRLTAEARTAAGAEELLADAESLLAAARRE
jgi:phosphoglucosamine mutase